MLPVLILQTGNPPQAVSAAHGGFDRMVCEGSGLKPDRIAVVRAYKGERPLAPGSYSAALITGSRANVTDRAPWSEECAGWVRDAMDLSLPLFGICYGHQLMADALGGRVDYHPGGREVGTHRVELTEAGKADELLTATSKADTAQTRMGKADSAPAGMPAMFEAHFIHEQSVMEPPPGSTVLARNEHDANQMLRVGPRAWSVQFHPEFTAPIMRAYLDVMESFLGKEGLDVQALRRQVVDAEASQSVMRRFFLNQGLV